MSISINSSSIQNSSIRDKHLSAITRALHTQGFTTKDNGATVGEIADLANLSRAHIYRLINTASARRMGIYQTYRSKQPHHYYMDPDTFLAYQLAEKGALSDTPANITDRSNVDTAVNVTARFTDPDTEKIYRMLEEVNVKGLLLLEKLEPDANAFNGTVAGMSGPARFLKALPDRMVTMTPRVFANAVDEFEELPLAKKWANLTYLMMGVMSEVEVQ